jgi:hypothetical protein
MQLVPLHLGPSRQRQTEGGKLQWEPGYEKSFAAISDRLIPSPILRRGRRRSTCSLAAGV